MTGTLPAALRAYARGVFAAEAAVELLVAHESWLRRGDFTGRFIEIGRGLLADVEMAVLDWPGAVIALQAGYLPCSGGEDRMLRLAASLAAGVPVDLRDALTGLDETNIGLVSAAVCHAAGRRPTA